MYIRCELQLNLITDSSSSSNSSRAKSDPGVHQPYGTSNDGQSGDCGGSYLRNIDSVDILMFNLCLRFSWCLHFSNCQRQVNERKIAARWLRQAFKHHVSFHRFAVG